MAMPVSFSKKKLVLDAIGALKVVNYHGTSRLDDVYCYMRTYVQNGSLVISILSFERTPPPESRAGAAFSFGDCADYLFFSCNKSGNLTARLYTTAQSGDIPGKQISLGTPELFAGADEQGYHWGYSLTLPAELLHELFGVHLAPGDAFWGNVYKFCEGESAFGAAFGASGAFYLPDAKNFGEFVVVPY